MVEKENLNNFKPEETVQAMEHIAKKIQFLEKAEGAERFGQNLGRAGDLLEKIARDPAFKELENETIPLEQKRNFWNKTRKLRIFMPLVVSAIMSLAGLFGKGDGLNHGSEDSKIDSLKNLNKIGMVVSDMDKKRQSIKMEKTANPFEVAVDEEA